MAKKLFVRYAEPADEKAVFDFYSNNEHEFVAKREPDVWRERIASGAVTLIEDEDGKIVASAISYPVLVKNEQGEEVHKWTELGSVRITQEGLGLFKTLLSAQVMQAYMMEPPEDRFAIEIVIGNQRSKNAFLKHGAVPFDIPKDLQDAVGYSISPDDAGLPVEWFQLSVEHMPGIAKTLLDAEKNPKIKDRTTGEEYELDFTRCAVMKNLRPALENLAGSDYGDAKVPNEKHGIKSFRDKFAP
ncbi:MAG: hypothetical protein H3C49_10890 [Alphaproteobacteria bacterium]|nr:hypothetical protein [Alphaproteobacteria bacterium]HRI75508.1 hypothetical protein [Alphaproteobacteria bacterium]